MIYFSFTLNTDPPNLWFTLSFNQPCTWLIVLLDVLTVLIPLSPCLPILTKHSWPHKALSKFAVLFNNPHQSVLSYL